MTRSATRVVQTALTSTIISVRSVTLCAKLALKPAELPARLAMSARLGPILTAIYARRIASLGGSATRTSPSARSAIILANSVWIIRINACHV